MSRLNRSESALESCRSHLSKAGNDDPEIASILAVYVSGVIYAEAEGRIRELVATCAQGDSPHQHVASYCRVSAERLVRSIKISELSGVAGHFSSDFKERFSDLLKSDDKNAWDALIRNRHGHAHGSSEPSISNLTFADVERYFLSVEDVLECFESALRVPSA